ncbi:TetR/AcrR family transcriptional regulator [Rhodococcus triatomae]|uniref:DNA-binding transcriptional regulator, AcrR family n=1 Tax=Rhodococcus triatomae TaxID=300028 RepID=A0A1G8QJM2_9NOCA|nr:TetR/AcrR family transcriptional regulator [Rhodococcus triatomae]QNG20649.1 TetR/AcrR family transcriptional regulator [Rhodococcus triatomae]QNG23433.1 TetR/AcrR family transcriptional regulator [Rhodococcus triatomae]SDJ04994.1 DNA-binding transcriptional regulator, AcrR family [Rhodococcus triatomae]
MSTSSGSYHHGDLPGALLRAAMELLEEDAASDLSLRAVARRAGVSTAAPYRHFADRTALVSAIAAVGYRELAEHLVKACPDPVTADDLATIAVAYVQFALTRPGLFRVMFAEPCDPTSPERTAAAEAITAYLESIVAKALPASDPQAMATATWALVHGLAFLHLDGKFDATRPEEVEQRVRAAVGAVLAMSDRQG